MKDNLPALHELLRHLQQVPYLASKNVYRVAYHFLQMPEEKMRLFLQVLESAWRNTIHCDQCNALQERDKGCAWCSSPKRKARLVCVVETWHDLTAIERAGGYDGVYHVLGGAICPLDGVGPDDLALKSLIARVASGAVDEIILALNQTLEGEATATYIIRLLTPYRAHIRITSVSRGVPVGSVWEMTDRLTIGKAITERRPVP